MAAITQDYLTTRLRAYGGTSLNDRAEFTATDFTGLSFANLPVTGAKFPLNSNFTGCNFDGAHMRGTFFIGANANNGTKFNNTSWYRVNAYSSKFAGVPQIFFDCDFYTASFKECNMSNSLFVSCIFDRCKIQDCDFSNSTFIDCQFSGHGWAAGGDPDIFRSNFNNCLFRASNARVATSSFYIPNSSFWNCSFEGASFIEIDSAGNGSTDTGLGFYYCDLRKSTFVFRVQDPNAPATTDRYTFAVCTMGNAVIPWQNPRPNVHLNISINFYDDDDHAIQFDRNIIP